MTELRDVRGRDSQRVGGVQSVDLVQHNPGRGDTGIGRYAAGLLRGFAALAEPPDVRLTTTVDPPLAARLTSLHALPVGVRGRRPGSVAHFAQIMGCSLLLWRPTRPAVATVHDLGPFVWERERRMRAIDRLLLGLQLVGLRRAEAVIAVSDATRWDVVEHLGVPSDRVHAVHSGIDLDLFCPITDARERLACRYPLPGGADARYVLYVGSELPRKNLGTLLRSLARVAREDRRAYLLKVGRAGGDRFRADTLRLVRELGLRERVTFFGSVPDADLALFYGAADVYVCPSFVEGFGFPVLEATACGAPVVASDVPALREIGPPSATFVPPLDVEGMARAILEWLGGSNRVDPSFASRYSWQRAAAETLRVYRVAEEATGG